MLQLAEADVSDESFGKLKNLQTFYRFAPAAAATVNGVAVAIIIALHQPGRYPIKFLAAQIVVVLAALVFASRSRVIQGFGMLLTTLSVFLTFSAMFMYIPTLIAGLWWWASDQPSRNDSA